MIVIENIIGLDIGDEVGLFDSNGLLESSQYIEDCDSPYGEILLGSAVYDGEQIEPVAIGSIDFCHLPEGYQLRGFVEGNPIIIKVWDASENTEYIPEIIHNGGSSNWTDQSYSVVDLIVHQLSIDVVNQFSLYKVYPNPFNSMITFDIKNESNSDLIISIFDIYGSLIETLNFQSVYEEKINWDASDYKSGIYLVNFKSLNNSVTRKISLIK